MARPFAHWLTTDRLEAYSKIMLLAFMVCSAWLFMRWWVSPGKYTLPFSDFGVYWLASHWALSGQADAVFEPSAFCGPNAALVPTPSCGYPWLYPPSYFLLITPFSWLPFWSAFVAFTIAGVGSYVLVIRSVITGRTAMWLVAASPALWMNLLSGQNGLFTAALSGIALLNLDRRPYLSGFCIGTLSLKPHLVILFPLALIAIRAWRVLLTAGATAVLWMVAGTFVLGMGTLYGWLSQLSLAWEILSKTGIVLMTPTLFGFLRLAGVPPSAALAGQFCLAIAVTFSVWRIWKSGAETEIKFAALTTGTMLISPYLLEYDLAWLALPMAWMAHVARRGAWRFMEVEILLGAWVAPLLCLALAVILSIQTGIVFLLALFWAVIRRSTPSTPFKLCHEP